MTRIRETAIEDAAKSFIGGAVAGFFAFILTYNLHWGWEWWLYLVVGALIGAVGGAIFGAIRGSRPERITIGTIYPPTEPNPHPYQSKLWYEHERLQEAKRQTDIMRQRRDGF
jgi:hypothetical protein